MISRLESSAHPTPRNQRGCTIPRREGHGVVRGHAERQGKKTYGKKSRDDDWLPPDAICDEPPEVAAQQPAKSERAGDVAGVEAWSKLSVV